MFERFTDGARRSIVYAQEEARSHDHDYIGTEHMLLGIVHEPDGAAALTLTSCGVSLDGLRAGIDEIIGRGDRNPSGHIPFTPRVKKVIELSLREALQLGHNHIGTEHILLALIRERDGIAGQVLIARDLTYVGLRERVTELVSGTEDAGPASPESGESGPADLQARLDSILTRLTRIEERLRADPNGLSQLELDRCAWERANHVVAASMCIGKRSKSS